MFLFYHEDTFHFHFHSQQALPYNRHPGSHLQRQNRPERISRSVQSKLFLISSYKQPATVLSKRQVIVPVLCPPAILITKVPVRTSKTIFLIIIIRKYQETFLQLGGHCVRKTVGTPEILAGNTKYTIFRTVQFGSYLPIKTIQKCLNLTIPVSCASCMFTMKTGSKLEHHILAAHGQQECTQNHSARFMDLI